MLCACACVYPRDPITLSADDWGVQSHPKRIVFRFHYHYQKVSQDHIESLGVEIGRNIFCELFWDGENVTLSKVVGDFQLGDKRVTLNQLLYMYIPWKSKSSRT